MASAGGLGRAQQGCSLVPENIFIPTSLKPHLSEHCIGVYISLCCTPCGFTAIRVCSWGQGGPAVPGRTSRHQEDGHTTCKQRLKAKSNCWVKGKDRASGSQEEEREGRNEKALRDRLWNKTPQPCKVLGQADAVSVDG